jgi:hypothetical protein
MIDTRRLATCIAQSDPRMFVRRRVDHTNDIKMAVHIMTDVSGSMYCAAESGKLKTMHQQLNKEYHREQNRSQKYEEIYDLKEEAIRSRMSTARRSDGRTITKMDVAVDALDAIAGALIHTQHLMKISQFSGQSFTLVDWEQKRKPKLIHEAGGTEVASLLKRSLLDFQYIERETANRMVIILSDGEFNDVYGVAHYNEDANKSQSINLLKQYIKEGVYVVVIGLCYEVPKVIPAHKRIMLDDVTKLTVLMRDVILDFQKEVIRNVKGR